MEHNRTLIQKAELQLSDLITSGGYLKEAQASQFIRLVIEKAVLMRDITVTSLKSHTEERDTIVFSGRVLRPGSEARALADADRVKPTLGKVSISTKLYKAEVPFTDEVLEDNIERGRLRQTLLQMLSEAISRDIEYVMIQGDTASADPLLATQDGFLKRVTSHVVNAGGVNLSKSVLHSMVKALPDKYHGTPRLAFYTNIKAVADYVDSLSNRATTLGDRALTQDGALAFRGIPIRQVPQFPDSGTTEVLLVDPKNLILGFWRRVKIESGRDPRAGESFFVASVRFGVAILNEDAVVKAINVSTT